MCCEPLDPGLLQVAEADSIVDMAERIHVTPANRLPESVDKEAGGGHG
jgi:hypothetical protein